jgi:hypothetical protein
MRRIGLVGLCLAGAFATVGASGASAAPPEFGRCVKVAAGTGLYATANCTSEGGERKYEWLAGAGPNNHFTLSTKPKTEFAFFEGAKTRGKVGCSGPSVVSGTGEITGPATIDNVIVRLKGCEDAEVPSCDSGNYQEIVVTGLKGALGVIKAGETPLMDRIGLDLSGGESTFECGRGLTKVHLSLTAIGLFLPKNIMRTVSTWKFSESKGKQVPERFEGGLPEQPEWTVNGSPEKVGLFMVPLLTTEEKIEVNTVV